MRRIAVMIRMAATHHTRRVGVVQHHGGVVAVVDIVAGGGLMSGITTGRRTRAGKGVGGRRGMRRG